MVIYQISLPTAHQMCCLLSEELVAKTWTHDARQTAAERANQAQRTSFDGRDRSVDQTAEARGRRRIGDDLGTGPAHSAYIEIRERPDLEG